MNAQALNPISPRPDPYRVRLISMPFAEVTRPPLGLLQLQSVLRSEFDDAVEVEVIFGTNAFAKHIGVSLYQEICGNMTHLYAGLGDWLFRSLAFPQQPDNAEAYLARFYPGEEHRSFRKNLLQIRTQLPLIMLDIIEDHALHEADLCGFTTMFQQTCAALAIINTLKEQNPAQFIVMGGPNCDAPMGEVLLGMAPQIDVVFSGPALLSFPEYLRQLLTHGQPPKHAIPGVYTRKRVQLLNDRSTIGRERDINDEVVIDYSRFVLQLEQVDPVLKPIVSFETSRGCWWGERAHCTFCGLNAESMDYRSLAPDKAVRMFDRMFEQVPDAAYYSAVDNILPKSYPNEALPQVRPPGGTYIFYEVKADLSEQDFERLREASVSVVQPGIEALNTRTLKLMRKGTTAFMNVRFLKNCMRYGITPAWNLLTGFPGEEAPTYEKYERDLPLLVHLPPPSGVFMVRFDRFSPYFTERDKYQLDLEPMDFYSYVYPLAPEAVADLAYYFVDKNYAPYKVAALSWLGKLRVVVDAWLDKWKSTPPILQLDSDGQTVLDSRFSNTVTRIQPSAAALSMLNLITERPAGLQELFSKAQVAGIEAPRATLDELNQHRLLFEEAGQYMSLVLPSRV